MFTYICLHFLVYVHMHVRIYIYLYIFILFLFKPTHLPFRAPFRLFPRVHTLLKDSHKMNWLSKTNVWIISHKSTIRRARLVMTKFTEIATPSKSNQIKRLKFLGTISNWTNLYHDLTGNLGFSIWWILRGSSTFSGNYVICVTCESVQWKLGGMGWLRSVGSIKS